MAVVGVVVVVGWVEWAGELCGRGGRVVVGDPQARSPGTSGGLQRLAIHGFRR